jgi:hypothetical protein
MDNHRDIINRQARTIARQQERIAALEAQLKALGYWAGNTMPTPDAIAERTTERLQGYSDWMASRERKAE